MASLSDAQPVVAERGKAIEVAELRKTFRTFGSFDSGHRSGFAAASRYFAKLTGRGEGRFTALNGVDLEVGDGEVFGLLGPNGAGKTTLIKVLCTLILPDSGSVVVRGVDVVKRPRAAIKRIQAVMAGNTGFDMRLTGRQNLEFSADLYGIPRNVANDRMDQLIRLSRLEGFEKEMVQKFSTGMMRKLLVCRALLSNAPVLLFDEPTANLDPVSAAEFRAFIKDGLSRKENKTIVLATHNLWEAEQICDRIALMRKGRVIMTGTPKEVRERVADVVNVSLTIGRILDAAGERLMEQVRRVDGVTAVEIQQDALGDYSTLMIEGMNGLDYNSLFQTVISTDCRIHSVEASQPSLEQVFLKLNTEASD